ncbi:hypothetical protein BVC93_21840 [Mycobacterium sp. MS1601]|uniref:acyl-CoA dehydrogenase family protein n=1 Tax=Mycobacterium sp. MS1601 TaxID=1936029 RepID=UPI0009796964|nr:acyl-CoA dehydrogenase family protein [Mycobacterium sp. MS1601]AQA04624.1 hypothetical protein BVC93_21840 [Mycobacterium sp. MS1601]
MNLDPNDEQRALSGALRQFLDAADPLATVRESGSTEGPFDAKIWRRLATEIGLHGMLLPDAVGGSDGDLLDTVATFEELGRYLLAGPYLASLVQAPILLAASADDEGANISARLASGELVVSVSANKADGVELGTHSPGPTTVSGAVGPIPYAEDAQLLLLVTGADELVAVQLGSQLSLHTHESIDPTQRFGDVIFDRAPGYLLARGSAVSDAYDRCVAYAATALAAEQIGAAQKCLEMAVSYANGRVQFGRPIGSFQAIKHLLSDVFVEVTLARRATWLAAWELSGGTASRAPRAAWSQAAAALQLAATTSVQVHGGIAITWEHDAHWYLKRAVATKALFGAPSEHYDALGAELVQS